MARRRKNDKRVLTGRPNNKKSNNKRFKIKRSPSQPVPVRQKKRKKQRSGKTVALMILILIAFVVGAGIGITLALDDGSSDDNSTHFENVTKEMTTNLNDTTPVYFDKSTDDVDYNNKNDLAKLNLTNETSVSY